MTREWQVELHEKFAIEFNQLAEDVQDELLAQVRLLEIFGPKLGCPHVSRWTLKIVRSPRLSAPPLLRVGLVHSQMQKKR